MRITAKRLGPFIIACKEDGNSFYMERYEDGQFGLGLARKPLHCFKLMK
jgi:hypothetical protein